MPNQSSAEENIDRLLTHFQQQSQYQAIQEWRQQIENKEARAANQPPRTINVEHAVQDFRRALLSDTAHSESAKQLLRELNRPAQPKFTAVEAWRLQNPANRPACLTPEQQTYVDRYDRSEQERKRWEVDLPEERKLYWETLSEAKKWDDLHIDQAKVFESWLLVHPDRAEELLPRLGDTANPPDYTPLPQKAYHSSGLFWLTVNLLMKMYGFDDRVARPIVFRLQTKWSQSRYDADAVTAGCSSGYMDVIRRLAEYGAHDILNFDRYLLRVVRNAILKENGYDRHETVPQSITCPSCGTSEIIPPAECPKCNCGVPKQPQVTQHLEQSIDGLGEDNTPRASRTNWPDTELNFQGFIRSVPDRCRPFIEFIVDNPDATDKEASVALKCSIRTIERIRQELRKFISEP